MDLFGKNFIITMFNVCKKYATVRVVNDQIGTPVYTFDLARLLVDTIENEKHAIIMLPMRETISVSMTLFEEYSSKQDIPQTLCSQLLPNTV